MLRQPQSATGATAEGLAGSPDPGSGEPCGCVPSVTPPGDRLEALRAVLLSEVEPIVSLTQLLRLCRDEHPMLWEHHADPHCRARVSAVVAGLADVLPLAGTTAAIDLAGRRAIAAALEGAEDLPPVVFAHAIAELLDERYGHTFTGWFRQRSPYQPSVGDPVPLDTPDLRRITTLTPTAPPWRLANRLDETRRVRLAGAWATQFQVVFDYSAFEALEGIVHEETLVATCHPNRSLLELVLPDDPDEPAFPVEPRDSAAQRRRLEELLERAAAHGATIAVLPELSVTEVLADELEHWVRDPGPIRLLVAGSHHRSGADDPSRRSNRAVTWVRGHHDPLVAEKHSPADRPVIEDITPTGWPEIRIYVGAGGWHLAIAICRDLLNPHAVHALTEAGANLVLAPAMSESLIAFSGPAAQIVGAGQAVVAVANNPADWSASLRSDYGRQPARTLFGHPGFPQLTRQVGAPDPRCGIALLHVGRGTVSWHAAEAATPTSERVAPPPDQPGWVDRLARRTASVRTHRDVPGHGRVAAVLVLLIDGDDGPEVLLTTRAPDLVDYPDQVVFPGGATDATDRGATDTALREAEEEVGLDPQSVHLIGELPTFALDDSDFLVTPILAWSPEPRYVHGINPAEVASVLRVPLRPVAGDGLDELRSAMQVGPMTAAVLDLIVGRLGP